MKQNRGRGGIYPGGISVTVELAFPSERKSKDVGREEVSQSTEGEQRLKGGPSMNSSLPTSSESFLYPVQNVILSQE